MEAREGSYGNGTGIGNKGLLWSSKPMAGASLARASFCILTVAVTGKRMEPLETCNWFDDQKFDPSIIER